MSAWFGQRTKNRIFSQMATLFARPRRWYSSDYMIVDGDTLASVKITSLESVGRAAVAVV